jgi:hypothetical protein
MQLDSGVVPGAVPKMVVSTLAGLPPHPTRFWLNAAAPLNALSMLLTLATFHEPMLALKAIALWNMLAIVVTDATFHLLMSALNVGLAENTEFMVVTPYVSHSLIGPYVVVAVAGLVIHKLAAATMLVSVRHVNEQLALHRVAHVG